MRTLRVLLLAALLALTGCRAAPPPARFQGEAACRGCAGTGALSCVACGGRGCYDSTTTAGHVYTPPRPGEKRSLGTWSYGSQTGVRRGGPCHGSGLVPCGLCGGTGARP